MHRIETECSVARSVPVPSESPALSIVGTPTWPQLHKSQPAGKALGPCGEWTALRTAVVVSAMPPNAAETAIEDLINLGRGRSLIPGTRNVDISTASGADLDCDFRRFAWTFDNRWCLGFPVQAWFFTVGLLPSSYSKAIQ